MRSTLSRLKAIGLALMLAAVFVAPLAAQFPGPVNVLTNGTGKVGRLLLGTTNTIVATCTVTLTNAQVLALGSGTTASLTGCAAQGSGTVIDVIGITGYFAYTAAYTGSSNLRCFYGGPGTGSACSSTMTSSGFIVSVTASHTQRWAGTPDGTDMSQNTATVIGLTGPRFGGGNAANTLRFDALVRIQKVA